MSLAALGKIAVIGASGWMGKSMWLPVLENGLIDPESLILVNTSGDFSAYEAWKHIHKTTDVDQALAKSQSVFLSIKPASLLDLSCRLDNHLLISIMAGTSCNLLSQHFNAKRIVRAMPNTAAQQAMSFTPFYATTDVSGDQCQSVDTLFKLWGRSVRVHQEIDINRLTALTGSGHGWMAYIASSLVQAGMQIGLDEALSRQAVDQLLLGMGAHVAQDNTPPEKVVQRLLDYAGTTAAGLRQMQGKSLDQAIIAAIESSFECAASDMSRQG